MFKQNEILDNFPISIYLGNNKVNSGKNITELLKKMKLFLHIGFLVLPYSVNS